MGLNYKGGQLCQPGSQTKKKSRKSLSKTTAKKPAAKKISKEIRLRHLRRVPSSKKRAASKKVPPVRSVPLERLG